MDTDKLWLWAVRRLPRRLRYWVVIDVFAYATTGKYGSTIVPELTVVDALERWERRNAPAR